MFASFILFIPALISSGAVVSCGGHGGEWIARKQAVLVPTFGLVADLGASQGAPQQCQSLNAGPVY